MEIVKKTILLLIIITSNVTSAQVSNCLKITGIKDSYNAFSECVTFKISNHCDSTIIFDIKLQEFSISDRTWIESWPNIWLKKITVCKPATPIMSIHADSTIASQWCPKDCIDFFGVKWTDNKIRGQEKVKVRLCRFAFYIFNSHTIERRKEPFCISKPFIISYE